VVAAAALIMVSVFAGFIYAEMTMARSIGFGLAIGVLLDAFLIRMTFTPAVLSLLGDKAWWLPGWLDRLLPNLDVEGAELAARLAAAEPAEEPERELAPVG
jgi:RND superfamily putative drug exporter